MTLDTCVLDTWVKLAQTFGTVSAAMTVLALIVGGWVGLNRYAKDKRLKAADLLLKMEEEHRNVLETCLQFDDLRLYENVLKPALCREAADETTDTDAKTILNLDRCLRFFYICTLLHSDMKVEETVLARAYYYYVAILAETGKREELRAYLKKYYRRLDTWMIRHEKALQHYKETGEWES